MYRFSSATTKGAPFHVRPSARATMAIALAAALQACGPGDVAMSPTAPAHNASQGAAPVWGPWSTPVNLGPLVNTSSPENRPFIAHDGLLLYVTSTRAGSTGNDIWVSQRSSLDAPWELPTRLGPNINTSISDFGPWVSSDDRTMYFGRTLSACGQSDLYLSVRSNKHDSMGWEPAVNLGCVVNSSSIEGDAFFWSDANSEEADNDSKGGLLYFVSNRPGATGPAGDFDFYSSVRDKKGNFSAPVPVTSLNSASVEYKIVVTSDGLEAFIGSARTPGRGQDIFRATRAKITDPWSTPVNLGTTVNSTADDQPGSLSADGTTLYFESRRIGYGVRDIWVTTRARLN